MEQPTKLLANPPIVAVFCQIKFDETALPLELLKKIESKLQELYPIRINRFNSLLNGLDEVQKRGVGRSQIKITSDTKIHRIEYRSSNQRNKLIIAEDFLLFSDENKYESWDTCKANIVKVLSILSEIYNDININRLSLRYVNRFVFNEFDDPSEYFTSTISAVEGHDMVGELYSYNFRLSMGLPNTAIKTNINHSLEMTPSNQYNYILDIDVLDGSNIVYNVQTIEENLSNINSELVKIFFNNITKKTEELCS